MARADANIQRDLSYRDSKVYGGDSPYRATWPRGRAYLRVFMGIGRNTPIKGVIRHRMTEEYYAGSGRWTNVAGEAMAFDSLNGVLTEAQKYGIHDCCEFMVSVPGHPGLMVSLPL